VPEGRGIGGGDVGGWEGLTGVSVDAELAAGDVGAASASVHLAAVLLVLPWGCIDVTGMHVCQLVRDDADLLVGAQP